MKHKIVLGIAGSSGSVYAKQLLEKLDKYSDVTLGVVASKNANVNWEMEMGEPMNLDKYTTVTTYEPHDFMAPFASGSAQYESMIICPCSMGVAGRVATGISNDLMTRAADVILKERRKLIIVPRETPLSLIHLRNLTTLAEAGAVILPAVPSFYSQPSTIEEVVATVVDRIIDQLGLDQETYRWG